jgi:signal transduction histidine kinase
LADQGLTLAEQTTPQDFEYSIRVMEPSRLQKRSALAVVLALLLVFAAMAPFASVQLPRENGFIPTVQAIIFVTELITAVLLYNQFAILREWELLILADGYLFSALILIPHGLSFPGAFAPAGLLGPSIQLTAWLFTFWHFGFCAAVLLYVCLKDRPQRSRTKRSSGSLISTNVALVTVLVCVLTVIAINADTLLPPLMRDQIQFAPMANYVTAATFCVSVAALILLAIRGRSLLDLWLAVAMAAMVMRLGSTSFLINTRFSVGFYVSRVFSVVVATVVLLALFSEIIRLHGMLMNANMRLRRERESKLTNLQAAMAAVTHEIKQPLTVISLNAHTAEHFLEGLSGDTGPVRMLLQEMEESGLRAGAVLDNIRALFKPLDQPGNPVEINAVIAEVLQILRSDLEAHAVSVRTHLDAGLPSVLGQKVQLQEVILNIVQNSIDAMKGTTGRERLLEIRTGKLDRNTIEISVSDSGPGIDAGKVANVFDGFVSTKPGGMGLGLAISHLVVERHGGKVSASQSASGGAQMVIQLPIGGPLTIAQRLTQAERRY